MKTRGFRNVAILTISAILLLSCGGKGGHKPIDDELLSSTYAELSVVAGGDSVKARRVLDSLGISSADFIAAVSEKAENLKDWQTIHEAAIKKIDVAALREEHRKTEAGPGAAR